MTDTYEGWSNRETWCANLWLANDEGLYNEVREMAEALVAEASLDDESATTEPTYYLAIELAAMFDEWVGMMVDGDDTTSELRNMLTDIGSLYRVDWREIAGSWVDDAMSERAS